MEIIRKMSLVGTLCALASSVYAVSEGKQETITVNFDHLVDATTCVLSQDDAKNPVITMTISGMSGTLNATTSTLTSLQHIPAGFRPSNTACAPVCVIVGGVSGTSSITIDTNGFLHVELTSFSRNVPLHTSVAVPACVISWPL